jgi:hypothetical protein
MRACGALLDGTLEPLLSRQTSCLSMMRHYSAAIGKSNSFGPDVSEGMKPTAAAAATTAAGSP